MPIGGAKESAFARAVKPDPARGDAERSNAARASGEDHAPGMPRSAGPRYRRRMIDALRSPWPWWVAGPLIGLVVPLVYGYGSKKWGISQSLQHICAAVFPRRLEYFRYDWRREGGWNLAMVAGVLAGGALARVALATPGGVVEISAATREALARLGIERFEGLLPAELFAWEALLTPRGLVVVVLGGFLVGFGARWANGCTSGHAISGLSSLHLSSLLATIGFFVGGLVSAHFLLPLLF